MKADELTFDEKQSLKVIKTAIASKKRAFRDDGLLLVLWGAALSISNFWNYYKNVNLTAWWMRNLMDLLQIITGVLVLGFTAYLFFFKKKKVTTYEAASTRFVWIGVILAHNINVIITKSLLTEINFTLLQPLQMVLIGFALFVTGGIYRYYLLVASGVIMWTAAAIGAHYGIESQFLIRSIAEVICFVIPGAIMFAKQRKFETNV
jgi:hypothetical protein